MNNIDNRKLKISIDLMGGDNSPNKIINSVAASDAFFPFPDGIEQLAEAGVKAIIQPGGSINDKQVIKSANASGVIMAFTKIRHFKH